MSLKINGKENEFQIFFAMRKSKNLISRHLTPRHGSSHSGAILYTMVAALFFLTYSQIVLDETEI